jgi:hypothetical protein
MRAIACTTQVPHLSLLLIDVFPQVISRGAHAHTRTTLPLTAITAHGVRPHHAHASMMFMHAGDPSSCCWPVGGEIDIMESYGNRQLSLGSNTEGNVFGTYHWADQCGHDLHCGGSTPAGRCAPYNFSGQFPGAGIRADFSKDFHVCVMTHHSPSVHCFRRFQC